MANPSKAEKEYWNRLANVVGCVACRRDQGLFNGLVSIHHISGRTAKGAHMNVIPLCGAHHQTGGEGIALHPFTRLWEQKFGKQEDLKAWADQLLSLADLAASARRNGGFE